MRYHLSFAAGGQAEQKYSAQQKRKEFFHACLLTSMHLPMTPPVRRYS